MKTLITILITFFVQSVYADVDCNNATLDYQISTCARIASANEVRVFNIEYYKYLSRQLEDEEMQIVGECTKAIDAIPALIKFEQQYMGAMESLCEFQLSTSTNYGEMRSPSCHMRNPEGALYEYLTNSRNNISPWDCTAPNHSELKKSNEKIKSKPSFDCAKAITNVEKQICLESSLSAADSYLSFLYKTILSKNVEIKSQLISSQKEWIQYRDSCEEHHLDECLYYNYMDRIDYLEKHFP